MEPWREIIDLLACPSTSQQLQELAPGDLAILNQHISEGKSIKVNGQPQKEPIQAALIRADREIVYPVDDGILVLLEEEGIRWLK